MRISSLNEQAIHYHSHDIEDKSLSLVRVLEKYSERPNLPFHLADI